MYHIIISEKVKMPKNLLGAIWHNIVDVESDGDELNSVAPKDCTKPTEPKSHFVCYFNYGRLSVFHNLDVPVLHLFI